MKRWHWLLPLAGLLVLVLATGLIAIGGERPERGRVYTVAEVQARLLGQPGAWVGRTALSH